MGGPDGYLRPVQFLDHLTVITMFHNLSSYWHFVKLIVVLKAGLPESPEELTKRITRGFIVELLNVVIINPIIQVGDDRQKQQNWTHSCYQINASLLSGYRDR